MILSPMAAFAQGAPVSIGEQMQAAKGGVIFHIPTALGAIVPTYNVPEASSVQLNFTPDSLSAIYLGDIQNWNDPRLVADNPVLANVHQPIVVIHRSDGSGTTFGFTDYLSSVSADWQSQVGKGDSPRSAFQHRQLARTRCLPAAITTRSEEFIRQISIQGVPIFPNR